MHAYENMSTLPCPYVMLNEVKHLYHEDPSLALRMTGNKYSDTTAICQIFRSKFSQGAFSGTPVRGDPRCRASGGTWVLIGVGKNDPVRGASL